MEKAYPAGVIGVGYMSLTSPMLMPVSREESALPAAAAMKANGFTIRRARTTPELGVGNLNNELLVRQPIASQHSLCRRDSGLSFSLATSSSLIISFPSDIDLGRDMVVSRLKAGLQANQSAPMSCSRRCTEKGGGGGGGGGISTVWGMLQQRAASKPTQLFQPGPPEC